MILPKSIIQSEPVVVINDQFFDLRGLSSYSSLGVSTLRSYISKGWIPHFKIGGRVLIKRSEFDAAMEKKFRVTKSGDLKSMVDEVCARLRKAKKR